MGKLIEKMSENPVPYLIIIGTILSALLFKALLKYADEGNLLMVVLMAVAVAAMALGITKVIQYQQYKEL